MQKYNDYINVTRRWLRYYNKFKAAIDGMNEDLRMLETLLKEDEAAPVAHYGDSPVGGESELNSVEKAVERRMKQRQQISQIKADLAELKRIVSRVGIALETLDDDSREIIQERFIDGYSWEQVGIRHHMSESGIRKKGNRILGDLALVIFGIKANPHQLSFVFLD